MYKQVRKSVLVSLRASVAFFGHPLHSHLEVTPTGPPLAKILQQVVKRNTTVLVVLNELALSAVRVSQRVHSTVTDLVLLVPAQRGTVQQLASVSEVGRKFIGIKTYEILKVIISSTRLEVIVIRRLLHPIIMMGLAHRGKRGTRNCQIILSSK